MNESGSSVALPVWPFLVVAIVFGVAAVIICNWRKVWAWWCWKRKGDDLFRGVDEWRRAKDAL
jgi:hypothetical protein